MCIPSCVQTRAELVLDKAVAAKLSEYEKEVAQAFGEVPRAHRGDVGVEPPLTIHDEPSMRVFERVVMQQEKSRLADDYLAVADHLISRVQQQ